MSFCEQLIIPEKLSAQLGANNVFDTVMQMDGIRYREVTNRRTLQFKLAGESYFAKLHFGVGWKEIFKNLLVFRLPIVSAITEWQAIQRFNQIGIPTTPAVAFGQRGCNPAVRQSFLLTRDLGDITSLETLCVDWKQNPPEATFKRKLILEVARLSKLLHGNGMNHRDFYICHFCLDNQKLKSGEVVLYLIDLHRVGMRSHISETARLKDLAALYFSAMDAGLSKRDYLRFLRLYFGSLESALHQQAKLLKKIEKRAVQLYIKFHGHPPVLG